MAHTNPERTSDFEKGIALEGIAGLIGKEFTEVQATICMLEDAGLVRAVLHDDMPGFVKVHALA